MVITWNKKIKGMIMKREKVLSVAITVEEYDLVLKKMAEAMVNESKVYRMSEFLHDHAILPLINGSAPQETPTVTDPEDKPMIDSEWNDL